MTTITPTRRFCDEHGIDCVLLCICPACGCNRNALRRIASEGGRMNETQFACWAGRCNRVSDGPLPGQYAMAI